MKQLDVVVTGPTPLGDIYGPPEELQAYVLAALGRGEEVDPVMIALVEEWRLDSGLPPLDEIPELRAKTGLKPGGGGQQQVYAGHGRYGTAYDLAVARAEAAKQRQAKLGAPIPVQVHSEAELSAALADPIRHRLELDLAGKISHEDPSNVVGDIKTALADAKEEAKTGSVLMGPRERQLVGLWNGDPKALGKLAESKAYEIAAPISNDPATIKTIDDSLANLRSNPRYMAAVARYGAIPIIPVKSDQAWDGVYVTDAIAVSDLKFTGGFAEPFAVTSSTPHPLDAVPWNIDPSMNGVMRHEYGHHVESLLTSEQRHKWLNAHGTWGQGSLGAGQVGEEWRAYTAHPKSNPHPEEGLSAYGRTNEAEAFAETFSLVTHPGYKRSKVHYSVLPMVDAMESFIDPTYEAPPPPIGPTFTGPD